MKCAAVASFAVVLVLAGVGAAAGPASVPDPDSPEAAATLEPLLPPVAPAWKQQGWRAVAPHAFVLRKQARARSRPDTGAPVVFSVRGGTRVPVLEQGRTWWRVGGTHGRSGWLRAADLEPHASWVFLDVNTGRVTRRIAAKGQLGPVSDGKDLWSLADTGLNRTRLTGPLTIWAYPFNQDQFASLPQVSVWPQIGTRFLLAGDEGNKPYLAEADRHSGTVTREDPPTTGELKWADAQGSMLFSWSSDPAETRLYNQHERRLVRKVPGELVAVTRTGTAFVRRGPWVGRYNTGLTGGKFVSTAAEYATCCLSADEKVLAISGYQESRFLVTLRSADTMQLLGTLDAGSNPFYVQALSQSAGGWFLVGNGEGPGDSRILRFNRSGRKVAAWDISANWTASPEGTRFFAVRDRDILTLDTRSGRVRRFPLRWRRPLPQRYLPRPSSPDFPTHLDVSALTVTPDGKTLIVTEYLNGDPAG